MTPRRTARIPLRRFPVFFGTFEGLGNTISHLSITDTFPGDTVALFAFSAGTIADFGLIDVKIIGPFGATFRSLPTDVGGVAGVTNFGMRGVFVSGEVSAGDFIAIGGAVGVNDATMTNCHSTVDVKGRNNSWVAGLAGSNNGGAITDSFATGSVSGGDVSYTGGVAGYNYGPLIRTHATGAVSGGNNAAVGGLAGTGGFVSDIRDSFATGPVTGGTNANVGGLVGTNGGGIGASFASGTASALNKGKVGGLAGLSTGPILNAYATGGVTAGDSSDAGGLVGLDQFGNSGVIQTSYSTGSIKAGARAFVGGMLGFDQISFRVFTDTYWDTTTSGVTDPSKGAGNKKNDPGIDGLTTAQLRSGLAGRLQQHCLGREIQHQRRLALFAGEPASQFVAIGDRGDAAFRLAIRRSAGSAFVGRCAGNHAERTDAREVRVTGHRSPRRRRWQLAA